MHQKTDAILTTSKKPSPSQNVLCGERNFFRIYKDKNEMVL